MKKIFLLAVTGLLMSACGSENNNNALEGEVLVDGSSTVYPITEAVAEEFGKENPKVRVTVGVSGTGGGFKKFGRGETDISNASRAIKPEEIEACKANNIEFIELPIAFDGLAVVINPENTFVDYLTVSELKKIWAPEAQDKITSWKQVRASFPDVPLHLYGPGVASGTFDYFTEAIVGKAKSSRGDYTASEDDNVLVQGVSTDKGGLAFFGLEYFEVNKDKLKLVSVDEEKGAGPLLPTKESVTNGTYSPLSRPLLIYVNKKSAERKEVDAFINYYITNGGMLANQSGYIALPEEAYKLAAERYSKRVTGTIFGEKSSVGIKIEEMLKLK